MLQPESVSTCYFERRLEPAAMSRASESLGQADTLDITRARDIISKQVEAGKDSTGHLTVLL